MDWKKFENTLPLKIRRTRKRPNVSGLDHQYIKNICGVLKEGTKTVILPGRTIKGKQKIANYVGNLCESITFGRVKPYFTKNAEIQDRKANGLYPELYKNLKLIAQTYFPDFEFNTITLNHNLQCQPHKDSKNVGNSIIIGFGDYKDGELNIEGEKHDIKYKPLKFNGALKKHWVEPFTGERWTAVYFNTKFK